MFRCWRTKGAAPRTRSGAPGCLGAWSRLWTMLEEDFAALRKLRDDDASGALKEYLGDSEDPREWNDEAVEVEDGRVTKLFLRMPKLTALPDAIGELKALTTLYLGGCASLAALPATIGELGALTELDLTGCSSLTTLPDAIRAMPGLTICDSNSGLDKASYLMRKWDVADQGQPEEEHKAEVDRKILAKSEDISDAEMLTLRRYRRRVCDACGRQGTVQEERFPVCWCGARRYCNEACQLVDWDRGHSATCASGHTFPQNLLNDLRVFYVDAESNKIFQKVAYEQYPPPADRVR